MESRMYDEMAQMEREHWWFQGRRAIVFDILSRHAPSGRLLDIGVGTGFNAQLLAERGYQVDGLEPAPEGIAFARKNAPNIALLETTFPSDEIASSTYDIVLLLDVLEHLPDDVAALNDVMRVLKPGGKVIITVPAFMFLWTDHDKRAHHYRRYVRSELSRVLMLAGFSINKCSYYNFFLFLPILFVRALGKIFRSNKEVSDFDKTPQVLNWLLATMFAIERFLLKTSRFPFGVSLMAVAEKPIV